MLGKLRKVCPVFVLDANSTLPDIISLFIILSVGQLPQSSYLALGTPYSYFGLGRTNNYVENLFVGSTLRQPVHFISIEGLIPNSQVVIDPWQPENGMDPSTWSKELYLHPGDWIPWVTLVLGAAIGLLGVVVFVLNVRERVSSTCLDL